jgi:putative hydrolase of the HAD superfamily
MNPQHIAPHPGARPPKIDQDPAELALAARYAPRILFDRNEPFDPIAVGYTIFRNDDYSPSFPRCIGLLPRGRAPSALAIEYAIWWDWDITHLYELEHVWTFVESDGTVLHSEGSWHGDFHVLRQWNGGTPLHNGTHPAAYAQPGKHAFAGNIRMFQLMQDYVRESCNERAGAAGVLLTGIFKEMIAPYKTKENDALVKAYLEPQAFEPLFKWDKRFDVTPEHLVPWPLLHQWIPERIDYVLSRLRAGEDIS